MTPYLADPDVTLWHGDAVDVLRSMEADSVDCVVTSPPYWGLRDYGTGMWEGGDEACDHARPTTTLNAGFNERWGQGAGERKQEHKNDGQYAQACDKCGARRVDEQLGLEPTPDQYVERMVEVFREVRRVLAPHGTCWVNLGDSYATTSGGGQQVPQTNAGSLRGGISTREGPPEPSLACPAPQGTGYPSRTGAGKIPGLKPKDLVGIPWRVAFALQADGWYLRSDIVWAKPNPMPESVTDRPTKAHEYVFLLTKQPRYWFDAEAVREPAEYGRGTDPTGRMWDRVGNGGKSAEHTPGAKGHTFEGGRNVRSVWTIATQPYPEAHFATYPEELVRRCVLAGCPERVCRVCGEPSVRIVERGESDYSKLKGDRNWRDLAEISASQGKGVRPGQSENKPSHANHTMTDRGTVPSLKPRANLGMVWSDCSCPLPSASETDLGVETRRSSGGGSSLSKWRPGVVLDPFVGSGTTCKVARDHGRHSVGIDLNADYLALAARRLQQLSLLTGEAMQ